MDEAVFFRRLDNDLFDEDGKLVLSADALAIAEVELGLDPDRPKGSGWAWLPAPIWMTRASVSPTRCSMMKAVPSGAGFRRFSFASADSVVFDDGIWVPFRSESERP